MRTLIPPSPAVGMTLVEVLVTLLVLSVGMLGVATLLVLGIRNSQSAMLRTHAVHVVSDMADRIRANPEARSAYDTSTYGGAPQLRNCAPEAFASEGDNCNAAQLAEDDLARWQEMVRITLPGLPDAEEMAVVRFHPGVGIEPDRYRVQVAWQEPRGPGKSDEPAIQRHSYQADIVLLPTR